MSNPLTRKLELFGALPEVDKEYLDRVIRTKRTLEAKTSVIREGDEPDGVHLVLSGLACRYKLLPDGRRQIFAYLIPGDFCDLNVFILKTMDHGIETLARCEMVDIPRARILEMTSRPHLARALWWATLVDEATLREWLVNLGQRDAVHGIAHVFCEMHLRMKVIGLVQGNSLSLPITQSELGDTMGLSSVHVNRALQDLRNKGLIVLRSGVLSIPDLNLLRQMSGFTPNYLHLEGGNWDVGQSPTDAQELS